MTPITPISAFVKALPSAGWTSATPRRLPMASLRGRPVIVIGLAKSEELNNLLADKSREEVRVIIDKVNTPVIVNNIKVSPSVEQFRQNVVKAAAEDAKKVVIAAPQGVALFPVIEIWVMRRFSDLVSTVAKSFARAQALLQKEMRDVAHRADEKASLAKAQERKEAFKAETLKELASHENYLEETEILLPGRMDFFSPLRATVLFASI